MILSHLQPLSPASFDASSAEASGLPPAANLDVECRYDNHPSIWRNALARDYYLPWLWDLDPAAVAHKEASNPHGQEWDWELLVRQLAQVKLHEPKAIFVDLPMGLRNRRRIWRIVDDMLSEEPESYYASQWRK